MLYLYAIAAAGFTATGVRGLAGAPVESFEGSGLAVLATRHEGLDVRPTETFVWAHQDVVERLAERGDVLPLRIATTLDDGDSARALLSGRRAEFSRSLDRIRGAVEFGVRAIGEEPAEVPVDDRAASSGGPGTAYMLDRLARRRGRDALRREVLEPLRPYARDATVRPDRAAGTALSVAYLVDRDAASDFQLRVAELDDRLAATRLLCTGPWPPYSFVDPKGSS
ncbi:GvpL/GvpF family gas vesicle protein [Thermoleophilia bacterium SCSIO 60948]|nr:GvpL/GvpF family gas vesicle protein [Thermoleophilia bacterium SCSIO 60948]